MLFAERRQQIGGRLKAARRNMALSQGAVALEMNVSQQAVSDWEAGRTLPAVEALVDLCVIYGASIEGVVMGVTGDATLCGPTIKPFDACPAEGRMQCRLVQRLYARPAA